MLGFWVREQVVFALLEPLVQTLKVLFGSQPHFNLGTFIDCLVDAYLLLMPPAFWQAPRHVNS